MRRWTWLPITALTLLVGCDGGDDTDDDDAVDLPPEICNEAPDIGDGPYFTEVTDELGLGVGGLDIQASIAGTFDANGDGWPDLYLTRGNNTREDMDDVVFKQRLLINDGGSGFVDTTFDSGITDARDGSQGRATSFAVFADLDNDGDTDVFAARFIDVDTEELLDHSEVLLNDGSGHFTLGPEGWFCDEDDIDAVTGVAPTDADHDGVLDLYIGHHYGQYGYLNTSQLDTLFAGDGTGAFTDVSGDAEVLTEDTVSTSVMLEGGNHRPTWGVTACDLDGDTWPELMSAAYGRQLNILWHADGDGTYTQIGLETGFASDDNEDYTDNATYGTSSWNDGFDDQPFRLGGNSSNTVCGDVDNDGDMDVLAVELRHEWAGQSSDMTELLINEGVGGGGVFERPGREATGLDRDFVGPMAADWNEGDLGGALFDFDNDGRLDVLVASSDYPYTTSVLHHQRSDGTFEEVTENGGLYLDRAHGLTLLDYDRDGDLDVLMGTSSMRWSSGDDPPYPGATYAHLYRNDVGQDGNRLMIHLEGAGAGGANRDAIGARIVARAGDDIYMREVIGGHGLMGQQHDMLQIIGTGGHCSVDTLEIHWPDAAGTVTTLDGARANYVIVIHQTDGVEYLSMEDYLARF